MIRSEFLFRRPAWKHLGSFDWDLAKVKYYYLQLIIPYYWEKDGKGIDPILSILIKRAPGGISYLGEWITHEI